jgi:hypothetical protein
MRKTDWMVAAALALCVIGLVGCGSGGSGSDTSASEEEAALEFTECLRARGVEVEDPKPGQTTIELGERNDPTSEKAVAACRRQLGVAGQELSAEEDEEFREGWLAFAKCVREHGVEMGDPEFPGPGKVLLDRSNAGSPAFEAAREACQGKTLELQGIHIGG